MNLELDDKELMKLYKERAEKAENELELERNKIKELEKRIETCIKETCIKEKSYINCFKYFENIKNNNTEKIFIWINKNHYFK